MLFLYAPIFVLIVFSFNQSKSKSVFTGFTLDWYLKLFRNGDILSSLGNTIIIAVVASILATILGTAAAIGISGMKKVSKNIVMNTTNIPVINPEIVTGVSLMLLFVFFAARMHFEFGFVTLLIAHITFDVPYVILNVLPKIRQMNPNIYEAALDLGATPMQALRKVIVPEILPGMISGFMLAVTLSIDDFAVTVFTIGNEGLETLSTYIYADARKGGLTPELRPLSTIIFVLVLVLLVIINRRAGKKKEV